MRDRFEQRGLELTRLLRLGSAGKVLCWCIEPFHLDRQIKREVADIFKPFAINQNSQHVNGPFFSP